MCNQHVTVCSQGGRMSYETHDSWVLQREDRTDVLPDGLVWFQDKSQPSISNGISKRSKERLKKNPLSIRSTASIDYKIRRQ